MEALARMAELGLDRALHPHLDAGPVARAWLPGPGRKCGRPLMQAPWTSRSCGWPACASAMSADEVYEWLEHLRLRRADQDVVAGAVTLAPLVAERLDAGAGVLRRSCTSCSRRSRSRCS